ncbi:hypothetical protein ACFVGY_35020 [Streptomyces sp. NPDC127106]|uniref:hypothetical protein n=1 Tax=Streptomyces sp. NPDC127106 TaxID=3345360 RepID=UPI00362F5750
MSYQAFCAKYRPLYIRYAAARVEDARHGARLADCALAGLAQGWTEALTCASPAARAWEMFTAIVEATAGRGARAMPALPCPQADTIILRHRLGLALETAAEMMGISASSFQALHRAALRSLAASQ